MFYQTESKAQGWRAMARFEDGREALLLIGRAECREDITEHEMGAEDARQPEPAAGELLEDAREGRVVGAGTVVVRRHIQAEQTDVDHLPDERRRVLVAMLHRRGDRHHLTVDEVAHGFDDQRLFR